MLPVLGRPQDHLLAASAELLEVIGSDVLDFAWLPPLDVCLDVCVWRCGRLDAHRRAFDFAYPVLLHHLV